MSQNKVRSRILDLHLKASSLLSWTWELHNFSGIICIRFLQLTSLLQVWLVSSDFVNIECVNPVLQLKLAEKCLYLILTGWLRILLWCKGYAKLYGLCCWNYAIVTLCTSNCILSVFHVFEMMLIVLVADFVLNKKLSNIQHACRVLVRQDVYVLLKSFPNCKYFLSRYNKGAKPRAKRYTEDYNQR